MKNTKNNTAVKANRRTAIIEANALVKSGMPRSQATKQGWKVALLYALFTAGVATTITFTKKDGSERVANALPPSTGVYTLAGGKSNVPSGNVLFWEIPLGQYRSCMKAKIVSVEAMEA